MKIADSPKLAFPLCFRVVIPKLLLPLRVLEVPGGLFVTSSLLFPLSQDFRLWPRARYLPLFDRSPAPLTDSSREYNRDFVFKFLPSS